MDLAETAMAENEIVRWRNQERLEVVEFLASRVEDLCAMARTRIDQIGMQDMVRGGFHDREIAPLVEAWIAARQQDLIARIDQAAESSMEQVEARLTISGEGHSWTETGLAIGGTALTVAPLLAVPSLLSAATVTTTSFLVFTSTAFSWPILAVGAVCLGAASFTGFRAHDRGKAWYRNRYAGKVCDQIRVQVLPDPMSGPGHSLGNQLLNRIDVIAQARLEALRC